MNNRIHPLAGACAVVLLAACNSSTPLDAKAQFKATAPAPDPALVFEPAIKILPANGYGYEPTIVADAFGNLWHTSHKENWQLALAPDVDSPTLTRSMSWARVSYDNGKTWTEPPGLSALGLQNHLFGDEGDMALDDAGHLYFADFAGYDTTITRWTVNGPGAAGITFDFSSALVPSGQPVDDRPWITAHGDGSVFYLANQGNKNQYVLGQGTGSGFGPGRYTVYASYDGARTFDSRGYTLNDSGYCRPAADHAPGSKYVYVLCDNDRDTLYSFVSADDGKTFERYVVTYYNSSDVNSMNPSNPQLQVGPDGTLYGIYLDGSEETRGESRIRLFTSKDHGVTWTEQDITPAPGAYMLAWLAVSADGKQLGLAVLGRLNGEPWHIYAGVWKPGKIPALTAVDPSNPVAGAGDPSAGTDYLGSFFSPDGSLNVVWDRPNSLPASRDIFFSRTIAPKK